jgi:hypothetical protein
VTVLTDVPKELAMRGIFPPERASGFAISLDRAEPWGGGRIEGRVERRSDRRNRRPVDVTVRCWASWLDVAPQLVGKKRLLRMDTYWDLRMRAVPIWLEEEVFMERFELGPLDEANWRHFAFHLPGELPRAFEGTFVSFRWRVEARRARAVGHERASLPVLVREQRTLPVVRIETTPIGTWRLLEWRSDAERDASAGPCSVAFEERRSEDMPLPGETRETELARRFAA